MATEAQLSPQAPAPQVQDSPKDDSRQETARRNAALETKRQEILAAAREKLKADYRVAQGLEVPAVQPTSALQAPAATQQPVEQPSAQNTAFVEALVTRLGAEAQAAAQAKTEAQTSTAAAEKRAAEAEARLQQFLANPAAFLQDQKLSLDQWNARLLNGGTQTPEERVGAAESEARQAREDAKVAREQAAKAEQLVTQHFQSQAKTAAVAELQPVLAKEFPFVNKLFGPEGILDALTTESKKAKAAGQPIPTPQAFLAAAESSLRTQYQATLQDPSIATILGLSVAKSSPAEVVASSPQTLTNRVTSSVAPNSSRPMTDADRKARGRDMVRKLIAAGQL